MPPEPQDEYSIELTNSVYAVANRGIRADEKF